MAEVLRAAVPRRSAGLAAAPAPIRVLEVIESVTAGVARHVLTLAAGLDRRQFAATVACPSVRRDARRDTRFVDELAARGVPRLDVPMRRELDPRSDSRAIGRLRRAIRRGRYDLVHAHSSKAGILARLAALGTPARTLYTPHAFAFAGARGVKRLVYWAPEVLLARGTDVLICVSESERREVRRAGLRARRGTVVIPNGIESAAYADRSARVFARAALGLEPETVLIGSVGRLMPQKGYGDLLEAAPRVLARWPTARFALVGEGDLEEALRAQAHRLGVERQVLFLGHRADVPTLLASFDLFVLPSLYEGLPYTLLEALATGLPSVATAVTGNVDIIRHEATGLLVPPADPDRLAGALLRLMADRALAARLGQAGQWDVARRFDLAATIAQTAALYRALVGVAPAAGPLNASQ